MKPKEINVIYRVFDYVLLPFMVILGGFKKDVVQQTHAWHCKNIDPKKIDLTKSVEVKGSDSSKYENTGGIFKHLGLFHMPIFGGWKNYIVLESKESPWYVGWLSCEFSQLHCLPIKGNKVKVLTGKKGTKTLFFGVNQNVEQVIIKSVAEGKLGDGEFNKVPLY